MSHGWTEQSRTFRQQQNAAASLPEHAQGTLEVFPAAESLQQSVELRPFGADGAH